MSEEDWKLMGLFLGSAVLFVGAVAFLWWRVGAHFR